MDDMVTNYSVIYKLDTNLNTEWGDTITTYTYTTPPTAYDLEEFPRMGGIPQSICVTADGGFALAMVVDTIINIQPSHPEHFIAAYGADGSLKYTRNVYPTIGQQPHFFPALISTADSGLVVYGQPADSSYTPGNLTWNHDSYILHFSKSGALADSLRINGQVDKSAIGAGFKSSTGKLVFFIADSSASQPRFVTFDQHLNYLSTIPGINLKPGAAKGVPNAIGGGFTGWDVDNGGQPGHYLHFANFDSVGNTYPSAVAGILTYDLNSDCTNDAGDVYLQNHLVTLVDSNLHFHYSISNSNGQYSQPVPHSPITVMATADANKEILCPSSGLLHVTTYAAGTYNGNNFYEHLIPNLTDLTVQLYQSGFVAGFGDAIYGLVRNTGGTAITTTLQLTVDPLLIVDSIVPAATLVTGNVYSFAVTALQPDSMMQVSIYTNVPAGSLGSQFTVTANAPVSGDAHPADNTDTLAGTVVGSYDPNEKAVNRPLHFNGSRELVYSVQFQNTGTYPAKNVVVVDTIDSHPDMSSFKLMAGNPALPVISWHEGNVLFFSFLNIYLPDSNSNEAASHGSFAYSLRASGSDQIGDSIRNTAYIYFDYNAPVVTNTTLNVLTAVPTAVQDVAAALQAIVYPNPNSGAFAVQVPQTGNYTITVTDLAGKQVWKHQYTNANGTLPVKLTVPVGMYLLHLTDNASGKGMTQPIVVQ